MSDRLMLFRVLGEDSFLGETESLIIGGNDVIQDRDTDATQNLHDSSRQAMVGRGRLGRATGVIMGQNDTRGAVA